MTINIRPCQLDQLSLLRDVSIETYRDTFEESNSEALMQQYLDDALTEEKLSQQLQTVGSYFYFIYFADQVAGFLKVNIDAAQSDDVAKDSLEIERFYIRKLFLRNGLGNKLMQFAYNLGQEFGKSAVWLGVWEHNVPALAFYHAHGFQQVGEHPFDMAGDLQTDLLLKREL
ncbi:spermidine/spermine N(1)-acetyltransferase [Psychromonas marina]|uniref:Spermidine/spermine N(1)-acetyltransferase n=1 Tax=Psychromonas marina TaxID=88364 RepID=A0ABQ6DZ82_9GAMM|nr:GNAT family N-acetyltransferase [Psychromonas marina]GLS90464.1 spermidine/spermine N(1)-acetyltransferase [Psychromonas marina]